MCLSVKHSHSTSVVQVFGVEDFRPLRNAVGADPGAKGGQRNRTSARKNATDWQTTDNVLTAPSPKVEVAHRFRGYDIEIRPQEEAYEH
jgi:hypothetical protein